MIHKNLDEINKEDLKEIIESRRLEDQTTEYKGELWEASDKGKFEFYKDITALANAEGGDLIVGITVDEQKYPKELKGLEGSPDNEISRLNKMIQDGIEPNIIPVPKIIPVELDEEKFAIIIRVHQSITAPNRIAWNGNHKFYIRINNDSVEMGITQLRNAFNLSGNLVERIQKFRMERLQKLVSGETPIPLKKDDLRRGKLMLHIIPFQSFLSTQYIDINDEKIYALLKGKLKPIVTRSHDHRYNLDGFLTFATTNENNETYSYTQFFRNGIIEAVFGAVLDEDTLSVESVKNDVTDSVFTYLDLLKDLNVSLPIYIFLVLYEVKGSAIPLLYKTVSPNTPRIDRDPLQFPEVVVDKFVSNQSELENILKPIFDTLWNAYGYKAPKNNGEEK